MHRQMVVRGFGGLLRHGVGLPRSLRLSGGRLEGRQLGLCTRVLRLRENDHRRRGGLRIDAHFEPLLLSISDILRAKS